MALSYSGLRALRVRESSLENFPAEFREGTALKGFVRAAMLTESHVRGPTAVSSSRRSGCGRPWRRKVTDQDPRTGVDDGAGDGERPASWSGK